MKIHIAIASLVTALATQLAVAQSYSVFQSVSAFSYSTSDAALTMTVDPASGFYQLVNPFTSGDGANFIEANGSFTSATAGNVYTYSNSEAFSNGISRNYFAQAYFLDFTNTSSIDQTFTVNAEFRQYAYLYGRGATLAFGELYDGSGSAYQYFLTQNTLWGPSYQGSVPYTIDGGITIADASISETLAPGTTDYVVIDAGGSSSATTGTPAPAAAMVFGLAAWTKRKRRA
jgi:hypothetical protein